MNVSLTPELENFVSKKVASGRYNSASEVVREALRLLEEQDQLRHLRLQQLKKDVRAGVAQLDEGRSAPLDLDEIKTQAKKRRAKRSRG